MGLDFAPGAVLEYQYRLCAGRAVEPAERTAAPSPSAHLKPGFYELEVRALAGGVPSAEPARLAIQVAPPFWQRREAWWSLFALLALAAFLALPGPALPRARPRADPPADRRRPARRAGRRPGADRHPRRGRPARRAGGRRHRAGRDRRRSPASCARRCRTSSGRSIRGATTWKPARPAGARPRSTSSTATRPTAEVAAPPAGATGAPLDPDLRRHLFLFGKEALANAARHAAAKRVRLRHRAAPAPAGADRRRRRPRLRVGIGERKARQSRGHGLDTMRERAKLLGAKLELDTAPGSGTRWRLAAPLGRRHGRT